MQEKTPSNRLFYTNNPNNSKLNNLLTHCVDRFCDSIGFNRGYFFQFLPHYSDKQLPKFFNPNDNTKEFKLSDLEIILSNLDTQHKKPILDYLCQSHGFICSSAANSNNDLENLKDTLLNISTSHGLLASQYLEAIKDEEITQNELEALLKASYNVRQILANFENTLRVVK